MYCTCPRVPSSWAQVGVSLKHPAKARAQLHHAELFLMCCNLEGKLVPFLQAQDYTPLEIEICYLCSLRKSGCSAELVGVTGVSQTPRYCCEVWIRLLFLILKPTCFKGHAKILFPFFPRPTE